MTPDVKPQRAQGARPCSLLNQSNVVVVFFYRTVKLNPHLILKKKKNIRGSHRCHSLIFDVKLLHKQFVTRSAQKYNRQKYTVTGSMTHSEPTLDLFYFLFFCWAIKNARPHHSLMLYLTLLRGVLSRRHFPLNVPLKMDYPPTPNTPAHWLSSVKVTLIPVNIHTLTQMAKSEGEVKCSW